MSAQAQPIKLPALAGMHQMIQGFWVSRAICVAAELRVPDLLKDGPRSSEELALAMGAHCGAQKLLSFINIPSDLNPFAISNIPKGADNAPGPV